MQGHFCQHFIGLWRCWTKQETVIYARQTSIEAEQMLLSVVSGKPRRWRRKMSFLPGIDTRICQSQTRISGVPKYLIFRAERNHAKGFNHSSSCTTSHRIQSLGIQWLNKSSFCFCLAFWQHYSDWLNMTPKNKRHKVPVWPRGRRLNCYLGFFNPDFLRKKGFPKSAKEALVRWFTAK